MSGKYALIIGNTEYADPGLAQLTAPGKDAEDFASILKDRNVCAFDDVRVLLNQPESVAREAIDEFFDQKKIDDLLVLYFSGHGIRDELGALYLAVKNTNRARLRATAIKSDFIREVMDQSHSKRQILILDCCNSGAFAQGTKAATGTSVGTSTAFNGGYGRVILTASDSTQFAWEGNKVIGETDNSLFTHFLVKGLRGVADRNGDGQITVDELYDYAFEQVKLITPKQTPSKFSTRQQGEIVLRQNIPLEDIKPISLPDELLDEIEDTRPYVREAVVYKLERILKGKNLSLVRSAAEALERIAADDNTSRRVAQITLRVLEETHRVDHGVANITPQETPEKETIIKVDPTPIVSHPIGQPPMPSGGKTTIPGTGTSKKLIPGLIAVFLGILLLICCSAAIYILNSYSPPPIPLLTPTPPASAIPESTNTNVAESIGTENALVLAQSRDEFMRALDSSAPFVSNLKNDGSLKHNAEDSDVKTSYAEVNLKDFIVSATFLNPYSGTANPWDYGFLVRDDGDNGEYRLIISSKKNWSLRNRTGSSDSTIIQTGEILNFDITKDGSNSVRIYCLGDRGMLYVNGDFIAELDLSARTNAGDIAVATGMLKGDEVNGASTDYRDFMIRSIPKTYGPEKGSLQHNSDDDKVEIADTSANLKNFIAKAVFTNPYSATTGSWDYGFLFRDEYSNNQYRLYITSEKKWVLDNNVGTGDGVTIDEGFLWELDTNQDGSNTVWLYCLDNRGLLYINGDFITELDLSTRQNSGTIRLGTGILKGDEINGYSTEYADFMIWKIP